MNRIMQSAGFLSFSLMGKFKSLDASPMRLDVSISFKVSYIEGHQTGLGFEQGIRLAGSPMTTGASTFSTLSFV